MAQTNQLSLHLRVVSQEKELLSTDVDQVTAPAGEGEVTILPGHIPLLAKLDYGVITYLINGEPHELVVSKGFINVEPSDTVTVIVDTAKYIRDISLEKAEEAIENARKTLVNSRDRQELIMAEASLRQAMLEVKVARKSKKAKI